MGQYHKVVNLDKQEYLNPHDFGDGIKLMEFGGSAHGTLSALAGLLLLDVQQEGPWAGSRLTITGDYGDEGRFVPPEFAEHNLYSLVSGHLDEEDEDADEGEGAGNDAKPKGNAPVYKALKEECERQLAGLGVKMSFGKFGTTGVPGVEGDMGRVYDQPEDMLQALELRPSEDLRQVLEDCLRIVRCSKYANRLSWTRVASAGFELDAESGKAKSMMVMFLNDREKDFPASMTRTLHFPATVQSVRDFFMVVEPTPQLK